MILSLQIQVKMEWNNICFSMKTVCIRRKKTNQVLAGVPYFGQTSIHVISNRKLTQIYGIHNRVLTELLKKKLGKNTLSAPKVTQELFHDFQQLFTGFLQPSYIICPCKASIKHEAEETNIIC